MRVTFCRIQMTKCVAGPWFSTYSLRCYTTPCIEEDLGFNAYLFSSQYGISTCLMFEMTAGEGKNKVYRKCTSAIYALIGPESK